MSEECVPDSKRRINVLMWIASSGLAAAVLAVWASLFGLLYRAGWLNAFGVDPDHFLPATTFELTLWSYFAMVQAWSDAKAMAHTALLWCFGIALTGVALGIGTALAMRKSEQRLSRLRADLRVQATLGISTGIGMVTLAPLALVAAAAVLLFPPLPAYQLGMNAAVKAVERYRVRGTSHCHTLRTTSGAIGECPMLIAQTTERIAFLDGDSVRVVPAAGVEVSWKMPGLSAKASP